MERIPVAGPWISEKEIAYVTDAVTRGWYGQAHEYVSRFEAAFGRWVGADHALALPSCTSAIHLALAGLGIGPGDEVVVPDATWIASAAPVSYVGATPVFADVDPRTWCLDAASFERAITPRTRAVIPVDLYGGMPDWDALSDIADRHGVAVIEDAAEAAGAMWKGRLAGGLGRAGVFSFHGSKTLTTGEGGMLVTSDGDLARRARILRDHGRQPGDTLFRNEEVAFKYRMSGLQAALGLAQLERIEELVERKRAIFGWYREELADVAGLTLNHEPEGTRHVFWMVTVILDPGWGVSKEILIEDLAREGIDTRPFFYPLSSLRAYAGTPSAAGASSRNPVSYRLGAYGVNLPSALSLTRSQVARVGAAVRARLAARAPHRVAGRA